MTNKTFDYINIQLIKERDNQLWQYIFLQMKYTHTHIHISMVSRRYIIMLGLHINNSILFTSRPFSIMLMIKILMQKNLGLK